MIMNTKQHSLHPSNHKAFAEVLESSLTQCTIQCWEWDKAPSFGEIVTIPYDEKTTIIGCIAHVETGSMDPMRYPYPYKKTEEELKQEQPQIFEFLKTTCTVHMLGQIQTEGHLINMLYMTPLKPAKIHTFVYQASPHIQKLFFLKPDYLHVLFSHTQQISNIDELLIAILFHLFHTNIITKEHIYELCQTFSLLSGNDYRRLKIFLSRIQIIHQPVKSHSS